MESPRKRQKLSMDQLDGSFDPPIAEQASETTSQIPDAVEARTTMSSADVQALKEAEVGITEFVDPISPGFSGILKKRCIISPGINLPH